MRSYQPKRHKSDIINSYNETGEVDMKYAPLVILSLILVQFNLMANPKNPYDDPFISEVLRTDSKIWSIELNNNNYKTFLIEFQPNQPCTTTVLKLQINSTTQIYNTKLYFNNSGIAVLDRNSITGISPSVPVLLGEHDTIKIMDTIGTSFAMCWQFPLKSVKPGNSLINVGYHNIIETSKPSIGSAGSYCTIHEITLLDKDIKPVYNQNMYLVFLDYREVIPYRMQFISLLKSNQAEIKTDIGKPVEITFTSDYLGSAIGKRPESSYTFVYNDIRDTVFDTVYCSYYTNAVKENKNSIINYYHMFTSNHSGKISVTICKQNEMKKTGTFSIYTTDGKKVISYDKTIPDAPGTYNFELPTKNIAKGNYVVRLNIDNSTVQSQPVTIY